MSIRSTLIYLLHKWRHCKYRWLVRRARQWQRRYALPIIALADLVPETVTLAPLILDDVCLPPYWGPTDHNDLIPLCQIARFYQPRIMLELGTAHGNLVANICRQCSSTHVYTVNALPEEQTGEIITYKRLGPDQIGRVYRQYGYANRVTQIFQNTLKLDLSPYLSGPIVDLAVIDACHDVDYVINDFFKIKPFISPQGLVLLHDTDSKLDDHLQDPENKGHLTSSYLACMMLRQRGYDVRQLANTWWGIWSPRFQPPQSIGN